MIEILLEQLHVFLRFMILLLEKTFPLVFIPHSIGLWLVPGHIVVLGQSAQPRKSFCAALPPMFANVAALQGAAFYNPPTH
jgi:hypothetical protein